MLFFVLNLDLGFMGVIYVYIRVCILLLCFSMFNVAGVTLTLWSNPLNADLCPVTALVVWLLVAGKVDK